MPLSKTRFRKGVIIAADADALEGIEGEIKIDSADNKIKTTLNATPHEVVTNDQSQTLSNKTITSPVINTGVSGTAIDTDPNLAADSDTLLASQKAVKAYVDTVAGAQDAASEITVVPAGTIAATDVQAALEELDTDIQNHLSDATDAHDASAISNVPAGSIAATDVQAAINELDTDIQNHITDSVDAHDASAISNVPSGNLAATDVQAALNELQEDIDTNTSGLSNHLSDATDAHDASAISVVPTGNLAASDVQAALNELQGDADSAATHIAASSGVHGVVGSVVGTSDTQTLTNKTITGADIRTPVRSDVKQDTKANLVTYALTATNGQTVFATDTKEMFQIVDGLLESIGGGAGIGGVDILFSQTFEEAAITDFTQTGMSLSTSSPIHGAISALMTHQAVANQSFKQVVAVDEKFRGQAMLLELNIKSTASAGNVTIKIYDETNAANIVASEQLTLSSATGGIKDFVAFTIPATCLSLSYTITALPEAGSPVTRIDDIICQLNNAALLETSVTVPNITAWQGYTPVFQGFGAPSAVEMEWRQVGENVEIRGKFTSGTSTAVEARIGLPNGYTSAGTGLIPSLQGAGVYYRGTNTATSYYVVIEPSVTYLCPTGQNAGTNSLVKQVGSNVATAGDSISITASVPVLGLTATSDVAIPLTQSGIVQGADSELYAAGNAGQVITAGVTKIPFIVVSMKGSAITWSGDTATINESGIYEITGNTSFTAAADQRIVIIPSGGGQARISTLGSTLANRIFAHTRHFNAGDTFYLISETAGGTLSNTNTLHNIRICKQGSLKQVTVNTNSKITIPTSELRFEGASARGTGSETAIVKFDTLAKIRGDAFTIDNSNGTKITMTKAGKLNISVTLLKTSASTVTVITKNQTVLTTSPSDSLALTTMSDTSANLNAMSSSWSGDVVIGDVIRVSSGQVPSAYGGNNLSLTFQEQDIQVSVSNTLPQFSESDSCVRLTGANGFGSSATTTRRFASVVQNLGTDIEYIDSATLGGQFIAKAAGIYNVSFSENSQANQRDSGVFIRVNGTVVAFDNQIYNTASADSKVASTSWSGYLDSGDIVTGTTVSTNNGADAKFTISKVGKPNVTGVDVTPFVNVPQPVSQSSTLELTQTVTNAVIAGVLQSQDGSGIYSYNSSTGTYTMLKAAEIVLNLSLQAAGATTATGEIRISGDVVQLCSTQNSTGYWASTSWSGKVQVGQTIAFLNNSSNASSAQKISVLATATSDQILTAPETFSTDTAALVYAGSGTYTLSTLANARVGTYITFAYAINTNTRTQTTGSGAGNLRPTQTDADMNTNGIRIYSRAYNAASTGELPAAIAIQIGKGLKGKSLDLYKSAGKVTAGSLDVDVRGTTDESGLRFNAYNENTGILILDAGYKPFTSVTSAYFLFSDISTQASGYLVINASKNPALVGVGIDRVAARAVQTSGQSITNTGASVTMTWDTAKTFDTYGALNTATGVFTCPISGYYKIDAAYITSNVAWAAGNIIEVDIFKNGVNTTVGGRITIQAAITQFVNSAVSDTLYLNKGDTIDIRAANTRAAGATTMHTDPRFNYFSIAKISGIN